MSVTKFITVACTFLEYRLYSLVFGISGFSLYSSIRKFMDSSCPLTTLGFGFGLINYLAKETYPRRIQLKFLAAGMGMSLMTTTLLGLTLFFMSEDGIARYFEIRDLHSLLAPFLILLASFSFMSITFSFSLGTV